MSFRNAILKIGFGMVCLILGNLSCKAQSSLILKTGIGLKSKSFTFANTFLEESFRDNVKNKPAYQFGIGYQYQWNSFSHLWVDVSYVIRDTDYEFELRSENNDPSITTEEMGVLRFMDIALGYGFQCFEGNSWSIDTRLGGILGIPLSLKSQYEYPDGSIVETDETFLPKAALYGAQLEPVFNFKLNSDFSLYSSLPLRLFWVQNKAFRGEAYNPRWEAMVHLGIRYQMN